jgi:hypothetical protein
MQFALFFALRGLIFYDKLGCFNQLFRKGKEQERSGYVEN